MPAVAQWEPFARTIGAQYDIAPHVVLGVIEQESGGRSAVVSSAGALGLMQVLCSTARWLGMTGACEQLYDPATNIRYGAKYLQYLWDKKRHDIELTLASYYAGPNSWKLTRIGGWFVSGDVRTYVNDVMDKIGKYL